ncbi:three component ABC system middle component [Leucobacter chromiireducens]|uniref:three component ABC system middle component n=1 Tax=Leucobacter chromiireducens TaxID=283877 RepID=UPI003B224AEC
MTSSDPGHRPELSTAILNPAIVAASIQWASRRHSDTGKRSMPWEYSFLIVPLVFHQRTRLELPQTSTTHLPVWINNHQSVLAGFPQRAKKFTSHVREGIRYGLRSGQLTLNADATFRGSMRSGITLPEDSELKSILSSSATVGGIFSKSGTPVNVFTQFGVSP